MDASLADLITLLELEPIEENIFRGQSRDIGTPQVFGGQVLGQALAAASRTVQGRAAHSLHAYFLKRGDVNAPIIYEVDRARDGGSFSNRRVIAIQHGEQIFNMTASFQTAEAGLEHQVSMPVVPSPESLKDIETLAREYSGDIPPRMRRFLSYRRPFSVRPVDPGQFLSMGSQSREPVKQVWMRAVDRLPVDQFLHQVLLTYVSDYELIGTVTLPHGLHVSRAGLQMASLDHAMWFHRSCRVDEWLLFALDSPAASGGRGLARGHVYTADGQLVATLAQEGLIRLRPENAA
ncbi:MAG: acyl-CoA thioesterase II [Gammaproteobacteria bacterium]|nr:acyl-CoA thioesterase II [Gammaproteobacteria bacterium]